MCPSLAFYYRLFVNLFNPQYSTCHSSLNHFTIATQIILLHLSMFFSLPHPKASFLYEFHTFVFRTLEAGSSVCRRWGEKCKEGGEITVKRTRNLFTNQDQKTERKAFQILDKEGLGQTDAADTKDSTARARSQLKYTTQLKYPVLLLKSTHFLARCSRRTSNSA